MQFVYMVQKKKVICECMYMCLDARVCARMHAYRQKKQMRQDVNNR